MQKRALGKGLESILSDPAIATEERGEKKDSAGDRAIGIPSRRIMEIDLDRIDVNPHQPRRHFSEDKLAELTRSVQQDGVLSPILLCPRGNRYEIVAGERRFRASCAAGLKSIPALLTEVEGRESLKLALVENLQRDDLNPIEEARAFRVMIYEFGWTQEEVGEHLGKDRSTVSNTLRLLQLPDEVQEMVALGEIHAGHVRPLLKLEPQDSLRLAKTVKEKQLSVRQTERMAKQWKDPSGGPQKPEEEPVIRAIRERLEARIGLPVQLPYKKGRGRVQIRFQSDRELERIMEALKVSLDTDA
ncbi:MAG: ParB/RepB/Spo0J family partition protein [Candidatus Krumholzibacteria bacterium]|jgi:ParB family chromosome partitioning protein|nr:ParB/RepB/Spo0J family partition protein [Candidatus Krumholzibacteria bacterium]MDP6797912.1 ParB/RepB/Spo0J family partition protein [Candidatus Krumholzibacteria bacterium]MDP7021897.1 ParB/RepB/Spo0J family partition protein [Candidatus Krumholzibacteria bacterium]